MIRGYQNECVAAIHAEFDKGIMATLGVLATGLGKTTICAEFIRRVQPARCLFFAHRDILVHQARDTIERIAGVKVGIEMAELKADYGFFSKEQVVIGTVQTQYSGNGTEGRMVNFRPSDFDYLFLDECFPSGTLIDGVPIERLKKGDMVSSVGKTIELKKVVHTFKSKPHFMVKVRFLSGREMITTVGHPVFSINAGGYVPAGSLTGDSVVFRLITDERILQRMRSTDGDNNQIPKGQNKKGRWSVLLSKLREGKFFKVGLNNDGHNQPQIRLGENDEEQSYASRLNQKKSIGHPPKDWPPSHFTGWQWERSNENRGGVVRRVILEHQCRNQDEYAERFGLSHLLQSRCWPTSIKDSRGDRWAFTFCGDQEATGQQEGRFFTVDRVESVEVLESTSDGTFGGMCPDGFVYNIEVEDNHNYFAGGVLVHNCHHWVAPAYLKVVRHFQKNPRLKIIGFTATPDRFDKEALGQLFQTTAYEMDIRAGIGEGWLVPIYQQYVPVQGLDYAHIPTTDGDLNLSQLSAVLQEEETVQRMIQPTLEAAWGLPDRRLDYAPVEEWGNVLGKKGRPKRTLVFCCSIKQAQRFAEVLNRVRSGMACAVWDKVPKEERRLILKDFKTGVLQILVNVGICGEGFDNPAVEVLIMGRPTKSRSLYTQFGGRGLRPADNIAHLLNDCADAESRCKLIAISDKPRCLILDFVGNAGTHKLITAADILGGVISDKGVNLAKKKMLKSSEPMNVMDALESSEEEVRKRIERAKKLAEERRIKLVARSNYTKVDIDPFDALDLMPTPPKSFDAGKKLSDKQVAFMSRFGIQASRYPFTQAKQLFVELCKRLNDRKATPRQVDLLKRHGYPDAGELPAKEAKRLLDNLKNNGWKKPVVKPEIMDL